MSGGIEFLDPDPPTSPPPGADPPRRQPPRRRTVVAVIALVVALLVAGLVTRAVNTREPPAPTATPTPSVQPVDADALSAVLGSRVGAVLSQYCPGDPALLDPGTAVDIPAPRGPQPIRACAADGQYCPPASGGRPTCTSTEALPATAFAAVRRHYPGAQAALARTEVVRATGALWYRLLLISLPGGGVVRIDVVRRPPTRPVSGVRHDPTTVIARAVTLRGDMDVIVTLGESGTTIDPAPLIALAADPGLTAR